MASLTASTPCVCDKGRYFDVCFTNNENDDGSSSAKDTVASAQRSGEKKLPTSTRSTCSETAVPSTQACQPCPRHVKCDRPGLNLRSLEPDLGFWRLDSLSKAILPCPVPKACSSGDSSSNTSTGNSTSTSTNASISCAPGHEGALCMVCTDGWARSGSTALCKQCQVKAADVVVSIMFVILGLALFGAFLALNRRVPSGALRPLINMWQQLSVVLLFDVKWPTEFDSLLAILSTINLDISVAGPVCMGLPFNFYWRYVWLVLFTALATGGPWIVALRNIRNRAVWKKVARRKFRDTIILILLMHPTISGLSFKFFRCEVFESESGAKQVQLVADYGIECYDSLWFGMLGLVLPVVVFFCIGAPVVFAWVLWKHRDILYPKKNDVARRSSHDEDASSDGDAGSDSNHESGNNDSSNDDNDEGSDDGHDDLDRGEWTEREIRELLKVLFYTYREGAYYFESVQMVFKVMLWASLVIFPKGSQFQLALCLLICFFQVAVQMYLMPFSSAYVDCVTFICVYQCTSLCVLA